MLYYLLKAILKLFGPKRAHDCAISVLRACRHIPFAERILDNKYSHKHPSLSREVLGIKFSNPIGVASGFDRNAEIYSPLSSLGFGFVEVGTVTPLPQSGGHTNSSITVDVPALTISDTSGYKSKGLNVVRANLRKKRSNQIVGCNIGKNSITAEAQAWQDYLKVFRNLYQYADFFSVNVWDMVDFDRNLLRSKEQILAILQPLFEFRLGQNQYRPILMKISPDLTDDEVDVMTDIMIDTPLDGMIATGPSYMMGRSRGVRSKISGRPLAERCKEIVARINERTHGTYPIIGCGGMLCPDDIRRMLAAGASLVEIYSGLVLRGPSILTESLRDLSQEKVD